MRRFILLLVLAVFLGACSDDTSELVVGDDTADAADDATDVDSASPVADDSPPLAFTTTTAPGGLEPDEYPPVTASWDDTLAEYPLLTQLAEPPGSGTGSASFVLVDDSGEPVFSGSDEFPAFMVTLDSWFGVNNYIEFTINTTNVELADGQVRSALGRCSSTWTSLSQIEDHFRRIPNQLPEVRGPILVWTSEGCDPNVSVELDYLFDGNVAIDVTDTGIMVSSLDGDFEPAQFLRLTPPDLPISPETTDVATTIEVPTTTTTTAQPD